MAQLASCANEFKIFQVPSYQLEHTYEPFSGNAQIDRLSMSIGASNCQYLASVSSQKGIVEVASVNENGIRKIGNVRSFDCASAATFGHTTKRHIGMGSLKGTVAIYDLKTKNFKYFEALRTPISLLKFNCNDSYMAAGCGNGEIAVFSVVKNVKSSVLTIDRNPSVSALRFHAASKQLLAACDQNGSVAVWDINVKKPKLFLRSMHVAPCTDIAFTPVNTSLVISVSYDKAFNCYDITSHKKVMSNKMDQALCSLDIHPNGNCIALGSKSGRIYLIDLRNSDKVLEVVEAHDNDVHTLIYKSNDVKGSTTGSSYRSFQMESAAHSSPLMNSSFLSLNHTQDTDIVGTHVLSDGSTSSSFLDAMGISEPAYEDDILNGSDVSFLNNSVVKTPYKSHQSENSKEISLNVSLKIENHEVTSQENVDAPALEASSPETVKYVTDNSEILTAINKVNASVNVHIDEVLNKVRDTDLKLAELADQLRVQDIYTKMSITKQFINQELKLEAMQRELLGEIYQLRQENAYLRNMIQDNQNSNK